MGWWTWAIPLATAALGAMDEKDGASSSSSIDKTTQSNPWGPSTGNRVVGLRAAYDAFNQGSGEVPDWLYGGGGKRPKGGGERKVNSRSDFSHIPFPTDDDPVLPRGPEYSPNDGLSDKERAFNESFEPYKGPNNNPDVGPIIGRNESGGDPVRKGGPDQGRGFQEDSVYNLYDKGWQRLMEQAMGRDETNPDHFMWDWDKEPDEYFF